MFPGHQLIQSKMADLILQEFFRRNLLSVPKKFKYNSMCCNGSGERRGNKLRGFSNDFLPTSAKWQETLQTVGRMTLEVNGDDFIVRPQGLQYLLCQGKKSPLKYKQLSF
jgi:hypothetical protein